jgi:hypothetical protein
MTKTPASAPAGEVTTPAMSSASIGIAGDAERLPHPPSTKAMTEASASEPEDVDLRRWDRFMVALRSMARDCMVMPGSPGGNR